MIPHPLLPRPPASFRRAAALLAGALLAGLLPARAAEARPFLSPVFGDHMVLQRGRPNPIWGWAPPGTRVRVSAAGKSAEAEAGADGRWQALLEAPPAGGPYEIRVEGPETAVLRDVLCGDVWLCGGQSNMELPLSATDGGPAAARAATYANLRLYRVADRSGYAPVAAPKGSWEPCSPGAAASFSAVAFYFGRALRSKVDAPIGLIESCLGGSPAESWMSAGALARLGEFGPQRAQIEKLHEEGAPETGSFLMNWLAEYDGGGKGDAWAQPGLEERDWKPVTIPGGVAELGMAGVPSVCWFRREVDLPDPLPPGQARIYLGVVGKMDTTYLNGRWVGASSWVENPRVYPVRAGLLHPGRNLVAVRVFQSGPGGGFKSDAKVLRLVLGDGQAVALAGPWRGKVSVDARPPHPLPLDLENYPTMPTVLYNGMIAPLAPLAISGVIWYQGEANQFKPAQYRKLLPALVADWRGAFRQPDLPFYIVSLPAFTARRAAPGPDGWTEIREAQAETVRAVPHTALAVTVDTGEADNIHPARKQPVGERLAADALALHYGMDVPCRGPEFSSLETLPGALRLHFAHADGGLAVHGPVLGEFSVAGADRVWHWARARIDGPDTVVVSAPEVPAPAAARYAWQANPLASLFNGAGLPAEPFRTDSWPEDPAR
ncbi:MAG TPA: sialate O-acetylesterase [Opitutaceae bacterium]|nr:sialate O-acetylesterase [Opitutaceae bacterium]